MTAEQAFRMFGWLMLVAGLVTLVAASRRWERVALVAGAALLGAATGWLLMGWTALLLSAS